MRDQKVLFILISKNLWTNPKNKDLKITYNGISVELIPWTKKFYEVVWNY